MSFSIPEDVTYVDAITHLLEVFIGRLAVLGGQRCMRSAPIRPELPECWTTGDDDAELAFKGGEVVRWNQAPCLAVSEQ